MGSPRVFPGMHRLALAALLPGAALAFGPAHAGPPDWCAAWAPDPPSEAQRIGALVRAAEDVSRTVESALDLYESAAPWARAGVRPPPLGARGEARQRERILFDLTAGHWLEIERALCACLPEADRPATACARLGDQVARACRIKPRRLHGIDVECLTKGR